MAGTAGKNIIDDEQWAQLLASITPSSPSANLKRARREVERALRTYRGLHRSPKSIFAARKTWLRSEALVIKLIKMFPQSRDDTDDALRRLLDCSSNYIFSLEAMAGGKRTVRDGLVEQLLAVWTGALGRKLAASRSRGGTPSGPLVRFLRLTLSLVGETPKSETLYAAVQRERRRRRGIFDR